MKLIHSLVQPEARLLFKAAEDSDQDSASHIHEVNSEHDWLTVQNTF